MWVNQGDKGNILFVDTTCFHIFLLISQWHSRIAQHIVLNLFRQEPNQQFSPHYWIYLLCVAQCKTSIYFSKSPNRKQLKKIWIYIMDSGRQKYFMNCCVLNRFVLHPSQETHRGLVMPNLKKVKNQYAIERNTTYFMSNRFFSHTLCTRLMTYSTNPTKITVQQHDEYHR